MGLVRSGSGRVGREPFMGTATTLYRSVAFVVARMPEVDVGVPRGGPCLSLARIECCGQIGPQVLHGLDAHAQPDQRRVNAR